MQANKNWEAECDFNTLSEAEAIKADKKRNSAAIRAGKSMVKRKEKDLSSMKKVAGRKPVKKSQKRTPKRKK